MNGPNGLVDDVASAIGELLAANKTMSLSTSANDNPWVAGVYFAESDLFHLTVILETTGRSLSTIRANPNTAVMLSSGSAFALYVQGEADAHVLDSPADLAAAKNALLAKAPEIELLQYQATAVTLSIRRWRAIDVVIGWKTGRELVPRPKGMSH
jgi:hypothetical protein